MKQGGFDAVIGNPPWGATFAEHELQYLRTKHSAVIDRMVDSYIYFLDVAISLTKQSGTTGFIVPGTIINQTDASSVRRRLLDRELSVLVNLGKGVFGTHVLNTSVILVATATKPGALLQVDDLTRLPSVHSLEGLRSLPWGVWKKLCLQDPHSTFFIGDPGAAGLLGRLRSEFPPLSAALDGGIQRGVTPDIAQAHVLSEEDARVASIENELLRPSISGPAIKRYAPARPDSFIIYTTRATSVDRYPRALEHLGRYRHLNGCSEVAEGKHPWWALHRPRTPQVFDSPKLIGLTTSKSIALVLDADSSLYVTDAMYVFKTLPDYDALAVMAVLQSRAFHFLYRTANQGQSRVIPQVKASKLEPLPLPAAACRTEGGNRALRDLASQMLRLTAQVPRVGTEHERVVLQRQIDATDRKIDELVYELYGLTDEEMRIVTETTR